MGSGAGTSHRTVRRAHRPRAVEGRLCETSGGKGWPTARTRTACSHYTVQWCSRRGGASWLYSARSRGRLRPEKNDIRFVEGRLENPSWAPGPGGSRLKAWSPQFTAFSRGRIDASDHGRITYGLERSAMYLQGVAKCST